MDATTETTSVERTISIAAPPETVWEFFVDADKVMRWMGTDAEVDARPGGAYRNVVLPGHVARGEFVELDPPRRLVFTWGWEQTSAGSEAAVPPGSSTIEVTLVPEGEGTRVVFVHRDLPNAEAAESHGHGWNHYLERLQAVAGGRDPGEDPWLTQGM